MFLVTTFYEENFFYVLLLKVIHNKAPGPFQDLLIKKSINKAIFSPITLIVKRKKIFSKC